jgi:hypothetical protein
MLSGSIPDDAAHKTSNTPAREDEDGRKFCLILLAMGEDRGRILAPLMCVMVLSSAYLQITMHRFGG